MTDIKTCVAGIIAAFGIAGAALAGAGTAAALTDQPGQPHITPSPGFTPRYIEPALGFGGGLGSPGRHRHINPGGW